MGWWFVNPALISVLKNDKTQTFILSAKTGWGRWVLEHSGLISLLFVPTTLFRPEKLFVASVAVVLAVLAAVVVVVVVVVPSSSF